MQPDLQQRLASSLSGTYSVERELGGGGMSRVFVAEETALGRRVVVKVLAPEVAGALSGERFVREIRLAARLQQANIVPVLRAGELDGLPYYTMPFVAGESLRAAMNAASANTGTLGASQSLAILRDVARALAYAHGEGVVHRDIKPENVLLSAGTAVVTDFGIAKAISEARATNSEGTDEGATSAALTSLGVALGTPGYMAPEQAAGDPDTDARADLYAWGVMAYELLAGAHPFAHHRSTHAMLRAHMSELPEHVAVRARGIPRTICDLIMRCLAKSPDERPARASDLVDVLDSATTADRSTTGIGRALLIYAALFALVGITTRLAITLIGLPHWVLPGAIGIMLLGLPVVLLTGLVQRQRSVASGPDVAGTLARLATRQSQRFTWRRAVLAGAVAGSAFVATVGGFMTMRHFGIGPFGSLIGSNALAARDRIVVADMRGPASDTALGSVLAEGLRVGLGESNAVRLVSKELAQRTLQQMERPGAALTAGVARDVAARVQAKAVLDGDVRRVGTTSILTVRLLPVDSDEPLVSLQETADTDADFSAATGRLARRLRARIGESLRRVNAMPPLEQVTTASLPALRKYTSGTQAASRGDYLLAMQSYRDAIAIDSQFVAPYVALGVTIAQISGTRDAQSRMLQHAYGLRSRLPRREQLSAEIAYWNYGPEPDVGRAIAAAEGMRNLYPDAIEPLQALPSLYFRAHRYAETVHVAQQAMDADSSFVVSLYLQAIAYAELGQVDSTRRVLAQFQRLAPRHPLVPAVAFNLALVAGDDSAAWDIARRAEASADHPFAAEIGVYMHWALAERAGKLREAEAEGVKLRQFAMARGVPSAPYMGHTLAAFYAAFYHGDSAGAMRIVDSLLNALPMDSIPPRDRKYDWFAEIHAAARRPDRLREAVAAQERDDPGGLTPGNVRVLPLLRGMLAMTEGKPEEAIRHYREAARSGESAEVAVKLAVAFAAAGQKDSAIVWHEKFLSSTSVDLLGFVQARWLALSRQQLAELYEERGELRKALALYRALVEQWREADPELQPRVGEYRRKVRELEGRSG